MYPSTDDDDCDYRELADQIASDTVIPAGLSREEALALARTYFGSEAGELIDGIAEALYREFRDA